MPGGTEICTRRGHVEGSATTTAPAGATTTVTVILTPIELEIVDENGVVLTAERTWIVGERVVLTARTKPPGRALASIQWVVPGEIVAGQSYTLSSGTIAPVAESAFRRETMQLHWIASKPPSRLGVKAATNGVPLEASAPFRVLGPTGVAFTSRTSSVNVGLDKAADLALCFWEQTPGSTEEADGKPGILWDGKLTPPAGGSGDVAFLQLIRPARSKRRSDGTTRAIDSRGAFWLDDRPMPKKGWPAGEDPSVFMSKPERATASVYFQPSDNDSPSNTFAPEDIVSEAADAFTVYLMYRPDRPGAIYVTLARLAWSWAGRAVKEADRWLLASSDHARNPTGSPSSELPTWSDRFTAHLKDWW